MNRISHKLQENKKLLSIYFTAGYPQLEDTKTILEQFMMDLTRESVFMMGSDKILTLAVPTPTLLEQYLNLIEE